MSDLKLNVAFNGKDNLSTSAKSATKSSDKLAHALSKSNDALSKVANQRSTIASLNKLKPALKNTKTKLSDMRAKQLALHKAINQGGKVTQKQRAEFTQSAKKLDTLEKKYQRQVQQYTRYSRTAKQAGIDTRKLTQEQDRLGQAYANNSKKLRDFQTLQKRRSAAKANFDNALQRGANASLIAGGVSQIGHSLKRVLTNPLQQAIAFESAIADVDKFVKNANIKTLKKDIIDLGKASPLGAAGIAQLVAAGGKINLNADDALAFAKVSERLSVAFGMGVDMTADSITTLRTGMNLSINEIASLGDAINFLGDNSASNAANITNILTRAGSLGLNAGLSKEQTAGLAGLIDGGAANSEMAATSMKNMLSALTAGERMTTAQVDVLGAMGFDPMMLAQDMQANAADTIATVLTALGNEDAAVRGSRIETLFGRESMAAVANLAGNMQEYDRVMKITANTAQMAGSAQDEYNRTAQTNAHRLQVMRARWGALLIKLGDKLLPVLERATDTLGPVIDGIGKFIDENPRLTKALVIGTGVMGVLALTVAPVITAITALGAAIAFMGLQARKAQVSAATSGMGAGAGAGGKGKFAKYVGRAGIAGALIVGGVMTANAATNTTMTGNEKGKAVGENVGMLAGGLAGGYAGGKVGALAGAIVGPVGAAVGGVIGSVIGGVVGSGLVGKAGKFIGDFFTREKSPAKVGRASRAKQTRQQALAVAAAVPLAAQAIPTISPHAATTVHESNQYQITIDGSQSNSTDIAEQVRVQIEAHERQRAIRTRGAMYDKD